MIKKYKRHVLIYFLILSILIPYFMTPLAVDAKSTSANTLAELRKELNSYKAKRDAAKNKQNQTQSEINASKTNILNSQTEIEKNKAIIEQSKKDVERLTQEIAETKDKIEDLLLAHEISNKDNTYLEYVFKATSISDLIVRYSISEQLANYNDKLLKDFESKVVENEQLQIDLQNREIELNKKIVALQVAIENLGDKLSSFVEEAVDAEDDIKSTQELINYYVNLGCGENEQFDVCVKVKGDKGFLRPLVRGTITSHFGYRTHPVTGQAYKFHSGTDIGGNAEGTSVYSAANGMVGKIIRRASCGGNQVYIYHTVNGVKYTTGYMHLLTIKVNVGDKVDANTVIGTVGGGRGTASYETCSTGPHLHFMIGKGWYGSTYVSYNTWVSNLLNPIDVIKFPAKGVFFYSRS